MGQWLSTIVNNISNGRNPFATDYQDHYVTNDEYRIKRYGHSENRSPKRIYNKCILRTKNYFGSPIKQFYKSRPNKNQVESIEILDYKSAPKLEKVINKDEKPIKNLYLNKRFSALSAVSPSRQEIESDYISQSISNSTTASDYIKPKFEKITSCFSPFILAINEENKIENNLISGYDKNLEDRKMPEMIDLVNNPIKRRSLLKTRKKSMKSSIDLKTVPTSNIPKKIPAYKSVGKSRTKLSYQNRPKYQSFKSGIKEKEMDFIKREMEDTLREMGLTQWGHIQRDEDRTQREDHIQRENHTQRECRTQRERRIRQEGRTQRVDPTKPVIHHTKRNKGHIKRNTSHTKQSKLPKCKMKLHSVSEHY